MQVVQNLISKQKSFASQNFFPLKSDSVSKLVFIFDGISPVHH